MNVMETVGMMSTGALVMLGGMYLVSPESLPFGRADAPVASGLVAPVVAPAPAPVVAPAPTPAQAPAIAAAPAPARTPAPAMVAAPAPAPVVSAAPTAAPAPQPVATPPAEVTRLESDLSGSAAIGQLESFVALATRADVVEQELTPAQQEIIAYFERTARDLNSASGTLSGEYVAFNDMAITGLQIRHFYTVQQRSSDVPLAQLISSQKELVQGNLCNEPMMRTLVEEHGFSFVYSYVSQDNRFLGSVSGDLSDCI